MLADEVISFVKSHEATPGARLSAAISDHSTAAVLFLQHQPGLKLTLQHFVFSVFYAASCILPRRRSCTAWHPALGTPGFGNMVLDTASSGITVGGTNRTIKWQSLTDSSVVSRLPPN
jgi:hypothetical protein